MSENLKDYRGLYHIFGLSLPYDHMDTRNSYLFYRGETWNGNIARRCHNLVIWYMLKSKLPINSIKKMGYYNILAMAEKEWEKQE